jgi:cardiolipin synthase (CMP-forming)
VEPQARRREEITTGLAAIVSVPNVLTFARVLAVPVFAWLYLGGRLGAALLVFVGAEVTDVLDGVLARVLKQFTRLGAILDPAADKFLGLTALSLLTYTQRLPLWLFSATLFRDLCIVAAVGILKHTGRPVPIRPTRFGKYATFFLGATVLLALIHGAQAEGPVGEPAVFAMALVTLECLAVSWAQYLWWWIALMRKPPVGA